jgi:hypothetical protein
MKKTFENYLTEADAIVSEVDKTDVQDAIDEVDKFEQAYNKTKEKSGEIVGKGDEASKSSGIFLQNLIGIIPNAGMGKLKFYNYIRRRFGAKGAAKYCHLYLTSLYPFWLYIASTNKDFGKQGTEQAKIGELSPDDVQHLMQLINPKYNFEAINKQILDAKYQLKDIEYDKNLKVFVKTSDSSVVSFDDLCKNIVENNADKEIPPTIEVLQGMFKDSQFDESKKMNAAQINSIINNPDQEKKIGYKLANNIKFDAKKNSFVDMSLGPTNATEIPTDKFIQDIKNFVILESTKYVNNQLYEDLGIVRAIKGIASNVAGIAKSLVQKDFNPMPTDCASAFSDNPKIADVRKALNYVNSAMLKMKRNDKDTIIMYYHRLIKNIPLTMDGKSWSSDFYVLADEIHSHADTYGEQFYMLLQYITGKKKIYNPMVKPLVTTNVYKKRSVTEEQLSGYLYGSRTGIPKPELLGIIFNHMFKISETSGKFSKKILNILSRFHAAQNPQMGETILKTLKDMLGVTFTVDENGMLACDDNTGLENTIKQMAIKGKSLYLAHKILKNDTAMIQFFKQIRASNEEASDLDFDYNSSMANKMSGQVSKILNGFGFINENDANKGEPLEFGKPINISLFNKYSNDAMQSKLGKTFKEIFSKILKKDVSSDGEELDEEEIKSIWKEYLSQIKLITTMDKPLANPQTPKGIKERDTLKKYFIDGTTLYFINKNYAKKNNIETMFDLYKNLMNLEPSDKEGYKKVKNSLSFGEHISFDDTEKSTLPSDNAESNQEPQVDKPTETPEVKAKVKPKPPSNLKGRKLKSWYERNWK